jgi:Protein of unknown function (DUF3099)
VKRARRPHLITNAPMSPREERRSREIRYLSMMAVRALCLVAAAVIFTVRPPLMALWLAACAVGMVVLPWLAVIIANNGPVKAEYRLANRLHRHGTEPPPANALPSAAPPRVIDADE